MGTKVSDRKPYLEKIKKLKASLKDVYNCQDGSYIISLSRKGPRLLEKLYEGEENIRQDINTATEFALPFIYYGIVERIEREGNEIKMPEIRLVDDAIYYGSTIEGLWNEMKLYEQLYGLEGKINHPVHACIKSKRSKPLLEMNIDADSDISDGFEHYFVKNLTEDLRSLNKCLEVEFPIVRYTFDIAVDPDNIAKHIFEAYDDAYRIDHPVTMSDKKGEMVSSVNVLLQSDNALFEKMRITMTPHEVRIASMAPRNIHMSYRTLSRLFLNTEVSSIWKWAISVFEDMVSRMTTVEEALIAYNDLLHNVMKSLVALANYFYSYNTIVEQKNKLLNIFSSMGYEPKYQGVSEQDVFYLVGNRMRAQELMDIFMTLYEKEITLTPHLQGVGNVNINYQVFETDFPKGLIEDIGIQNKRLLEKCNGIYEALSAMFYNQTLLLENGTRGINRIDSNTRLRFGHTFASLYKNVAENGIDIAKTVHEWVDRRIDQGCIVPQYVLDTKSSCWTRVFRPGENEDVVLGQLSRLAAFCFACVDKTFGAGWLPEQLLSDILAIVFMNSEYDLGRELGIQLKCIHRQLTFCQDGDDKYKNVIDYLKRMFVFEESSSGIQIGTSLESFNFGEFSSLGEEVDNSIREFISSVMKRCEDESLSLYEVSAYTNVWFVNNDNEPLASFVKDYDNALRDMERMIGELKGYDNRQDWLSDQKDAKFVDHYYRIDSWLVRPAFWNDFVEREDFNRTQFEMLERKLANYLLLSDAIFFLVCLNDADTFYKIADIYCGKSFGEGVINRDFLQDSVSIYKNQDLKKSQKEYMLLNEAEKLLRNLR